MQIVVDKSNLMVYIRYNGNKFARNLDSSFLPRLISMNEINAFEDLFSGV
jgi:hypothetical protein